MSMSGPLARPRPRVDETHVYVHVWQKRRVYVHVSEHYGRLRSFSARLRPRLAYKVVSLTRPSKKKVSLPLLSVVFTST